MISIPKLIHRAYLPPTQETRRRTVFRDLPKLPFHICSSNCFLHQYSDLEIARLSQMTIELCYPCAGEDFAVGVPESRHTFDEYIAMTTAQAEALAAVIRKSTRMKNIHVLMVRVGDPKEGIFYYKQHDPQPDMHPILQILLDAAISRGIKIVAEDENREHLGRREGNTIFYPDEDRDSVVMWFNTTAVPAHLLGKQTPPFGAPGNGEENDGIDLEDRECTLCCDPPRTVLFPKGLKEPYEMIPECRTCYEIFETPKELVNHLYANPKHQRPFKPKWSDFRMEDKKYPRVTLGSKTISFGWPRWRE